MPFQNSFNNTLVDGLRPRFTNNATGDIYYQDSNGFFQRLPIGSSGNLLTVSAGLIPSWSPTIPLGSLTGNFSGDLAGSSINNPIIANRVVTFPKIQAINTQIILGRNTASSGDIEQLTPTQTRSILGLGTAALINTGNSAGQIPLLDSNGFFPTSTIPPLGLSRFRGEVSDLAARLALANPLTGDWVIQVDTGRSYILATLPATTDSNWKDFGDRLINGQDIVAGLIPTARFGTGTADSSSFLRGDQTWANNVCTINFTDVTSSPFTLTSTATINTFIIKMATLCNLNLPATCTKNTIIKIIGDGAGGWKLNQNASQQIFTINKNTTLGTTGYIDSVSTVTGFTPDYYTSIDLICTTANNIFRIIKIDGNLFYN